MSHPLHNMACTEETAVLIHQLPEVFRLKVIELLESHLSIPPSSVKSTKATDMGLELYLDGVGSFEKVVLFGTVKLFSTVYKIYPLVTDLTVHGARAHMTQEELKSRMKHFGKVLIAYEERDLSSNEITNNYRVIIRHPEIPEEVKKWTESSSNVFRDGVKFPISFFCRFCRSYDHARVQCDGVKARPAQVPLSGANSISKQSQSHAGHKVTSGSSSKKCNPTNSQSNKIISNNSNDFSTSIKKVPRQEKSASFKKSPKRCNSGREIISKNAHQYSDLPMRSVQSFKRKSVSNHKSVDESESKKLRLKGQNLKETDLSSSFLSSGMDYTESLLSTSVPAIPSFIAKKPNVKDLNTKKRKDITSHKMDQSNEGTSIYDSNARDNTQASFNTASIAPKSITKIKTSPKYLVSREKLMALYKIIKNRTSNERRKNVCNLSSEKETLQKTEQKFINDKDVVKFKKSLESKTFNKPKDKLAKKNCELNFRRTNSVPIVSGSDNSSVYTTPIPKIEQEFATDNSVTNFKSVFEYKICKTEDKIAKKNCDFQSANSIQSCSENVPLVSESKNFSSLKVKKDAKVKNPKVQESSIEERDDKPQNTKEVENAEVAGKRKRKISKNPITSQIMNDFLDNSDGELTHSALKAFFVQVTNRKKPLEIARNYSANVHLIIWQLKCLVTNYYNGKERDSEAEREIRWIKRLIERMEAGKEPQSKARTKMTPVVCHTEVKVGIKQEASDY